METLIEVPSYATEAELKHRTKSVRFGEGYEQRSDDGINAKTLAFQIVFDGVTSAKAARVKAFLAAVGQKDAFLWTAPAPYNDRPRQWIVRGAPRHRWNQYDNESLTFVVEEDFTPGLTLPTQVAQPVITYGPEDVLGNKPMSITCATPGATIRYDVTEGAYPTTNLATGGSIYSEPEDITGTAYVIAQAFKSGMTPSDLAYHAP